MTRTPVIVSSDDSTHSTSPAADAIDPRRTVHARFALALLESLRSHDRPDEVLVDEDLTLTLPRRLGLSDVVDTQIRRYAEEARRNQKVSAAEVLDLVRLVARRPDADRVFHGVGRSLASSARAGWRRMLTRRARLRSALRRSARIVRELHGRKGLRVVVSDLRLETDGGILLAGAPSGAACALVNGVMEGVAEAVARVPVTVRTVSCASSGGEACAWQIEELRPELMPDALDDGDSPDAEDTGDDSAGARDAEALSA